MKNNFVDLPVPVAMSSSKPGYEPLIWAKNNCPSYITNDAIQKNGVYYYRFFFGREQDQVMFMLRWA